MNGRPKNMKFRPRDAGILLQTMALSRNDPQNDLGRQIHAHDGQVFLTRKDDNRMMLTAARYYHIVSRSLTTSESDVSQLAADLPSPFFGLFWDYVAPPVRGAFYLIHGGPIRLVWYYPALQVPAVAFGAEVGAAYYNVSCLDPLGVDGSGVLFVFLYCSEFSQEQIGVHECKFVSTVSAVYISPMAILCAQTSHGSAFGNSQGAPAVLVRG